MANCVDPVAFDLSTLIAQACMLLMVCSWAKLYVEN